MFHAIHGKDEWDIVIKHLRFVSEYRKTLDRDLKLSITYVVIAKNKHECAMFSEEFGPLVDEIVFNEGNTQQGNMLENFKILAPDSNPTPNSAPCYMPFSRAHVTCEGFLTLCCVDYQNYLAVADLKVMSLLEAWESPLFIEMRERHLLNKLDGTLCFNCIYGKQSKIEPLDAKLATVTNFNEAADLNFEKQYVRLALVK